MYSTMIPFYIFYLNRSQIATALPPCQLAVSSVLRQDGNLGFLDLDPPSRGDLCKKFPRFAVGSCWVRAAKSRQSCPTLCDPIDGSQQAPLSLGFSRQEH